MIDGFPLSFCLPLVVHVLAGVTTSVTGVLAFRASKRRARHPQRGTRYLWGYTLVFVTAPILSAERWEADAYLFFPALIGFSFAVSGDAARRFRQELWVRRILGTQWVVVHIIGMIGSYIILWTAFYVDNAHLIPGLNQLPPPLFWVLPAAIGILFIVLSLSRFATPKSGISFSRPGGEKETIHCEEKRS